MREEEEEEEEEEATRAREGEGEKDGPSVCPVPPTGGPTRAACLPACLVILLHVLGTYLHPRPTVVVVAMVSLPSSSLSSASLT